ncbi:Rha family transcriptional regulator [Gluconobacter cerinus]|uniref:Rha family transcriptional regulator n=1 Tax=Gluconobacter cerinus TaxID=38307 RepID=UPI001B8CE5C7|nr:Rha family transcriptional regulator [Gluconobacter cerinus]MBS1021876.1 Rha family transcriptional regulator [Gluconobacter cerinus]
MLTDITKGLPVSRGNEILPAMHDGELRILDTDLATRLGFDRPRNIRNLIKRYEANLAKMGVCCTVEQTSGEAGGRPGKAYYLNKKQAIFITAKSETLEATEITIEIIEKFDAYERGEIPSVRAKRPRKPAFDVAYRRLLSVASTLPNVDENQRCLMAARGTHELTGINPLELLGATSIAAPKAENYLTPTQIGEEIGMSARAVNVTLIQQGYQVKVTSSAVGSDYEPTDKGKDVSRFFDTTRRHGKGSQQQLKWSPRMVAILRPFAKKPEPAS